MLWLLVLVLPVILLYFLFLRWRKRSLSRLATDDTLRVIVSGTDRQRHHLKFILQVTAFMLLVIVLAGPRVKSAGKKKVLNGGDVMVCLDISSSMLAEDIKPNRLTRARQAASTLFRLLDREQVGLVLFAGEAYIQVPLTVDKAVAAMMLNSADAGTAGNQGTAIADAISLSVRAFGAEDRKMVRSIVIISDGEDHEGNVQEEARLAKARNVKIYTIGLGSPAGVPIPVYENGVLTGYKKDREGNTVISGMQPGLLAEAAEVTGGEFFATDNLNAAVRKIVEAIRKEGVSERSYDDTSQYTLHFRWFAGLALLLLALDLFLTLRRNRRSIYDRLAGSLRTGLVLGILLIPALSQGQEVRRGVMRSGNRMYEKGAYDKAEAMYRLAPKGGQTDPRVDNNLGSALYRQQKFQDAYGHFRAASGNNLDSLSKSRIFYNLGNAALKSWKEMKDRGQDAGGEMLKEGIKAYSEALRFNPADEDARYNLSRALQWLQKEQQEQKNERKQDQLQQQTQKQEQPMPESRRDEDRDRQKEPRRPEGTISREDAERILNAIRDKEMKTAEQIQERERNRSESLKNKDW